MTVLWFLQRPEHSLGKAAVFVSLASVYFVVDNFFFSLPFWFLFPLSLLPCLADTESLLFGLQCLCNAPASAVVFYPLGKQQHQTGPGFL